MDVKLFLLAKGFLIGMILALPTGPGAFAVIRQGIVGKPLLRVLSAACICIGADLAWNIALCVFGSDSQKIVTFFLQNTSAIKMVTGCALVVIGFKIFRMAPKKQEEMSNFRKRVIMVLSVVNPLIPCTITASLMFLVGKTHFTCSWDCQTLVIAGIVAGELTVWTTEILMLRWAIEKEWIKESQVTKMFGYVFMGSGLSLVSVCVYAILS